MTINFLKVLALGLIELSPIIIFLLGVISILGVFLGKKEKWDITDSLYFAFVTATTVGYGDLRPSHKLSKIISIVISLTGIILTGIIVAISLFAVEASFLEIKAK